MAPEQNTPDLDALLHDIHRLIDDLQSPAEPPAEDEFDIDALLEGRPLPESDPTERLDFAGLLDDQPEPEPEPVIPPEPAPQPTRWAERQPLPKHVAALQQNESQAYADWLYEQEQPAAQPKEFQQTRWTDRQKVPKHVARLQQNQAQAYADWLYEQEQRGPDVPPEFPPEPVSTKPRSDETPMIPRKEKKKKKHGHGFRNLLIVLIVLALAVAGSVIFLLPRQPKTTLPIGTRKEGISTILLLGTDAGNARTDTVMLLTLDRPNGQATLVSIPRDTLVNGSYTVPKLNSVYGANNGGQEGIEMVLTRVSQCIGYQPDGYVLLSLDTFVELIDALGGVTFDVPVDMYYNDPSQDLYIALEQGLQTLSGEEAMGLVRFRSGYADADLSRVQVQRQFLSALMEQAVSLKGILSSPQLLQILLSGTQTDLSVGNLLWLAETALTVDLSSIETATLPGSSRIIGDGSYYVLDPEGVAQTVNTYCNPYVRDITTADLDIRLS